MVIDCAQCEFRLVACGDCLVTVVVKSDENRTIQKVMKKGNRGLGDPVGADRHALGAPELRALSALAAAGLVSPLRYKPAQVNEPERAIVAL
jgi:NAD(P)H-hydrate repair Nnr-like enzyme with NAD(P)H-hydrate dehydratase domain